MLQGKAVCSAAGSKHLPPHVLTTPHGSIRRLAHGAGGTVACGAVAEPSAAQAVVAEAGSSTQQLSRACTSRIPPLGEKVTKFQQVEQGMWLVQQQLLGSNPEKDAVSNSFVITLADGQLMMISAAISLTEESRHYLRSLPAPVSHIVLNSSSIEHWLYATDYVRELWPEATVWACPNTAPMSKLLAPVLGGKDMWADAQAELGPKLRQIEHGLCPPEMGGDVTFSVFESFVPVPSEASVIITSRRAVMLADIGIAQMDTQLVDKSRDWTTKPIMQLLGWYGRIGAGALYTPLLANKPEGRRWRDLVLSKEWDRVLMSHLTPMVGPDQARQLFEQAYAFLD